MSDTAPSSLLAITISHDSLVLLGHCTVMKPKWAMQVAIRLWRMTWLLLNSSRKVCGISGAPVILISTVTDH